MPESELKFKESKKELSREEKMEILEKQGLVAFDAGLTEGEKESISELKIERELPQFDHYGPVNEELVSKLKEYVGKLGKNSGEIIDNISGIVIRMAEGTIKDFKKESALVMMRVSLPNNGYDVPRWHPDGKYFKPFESKDKTYKLVMTIKGPLTRFGEKLDPEKFEEYFKEHIKINLDANPKEEKESRKKLDSVIKEIKPCNEGQAVYYLVGHEDAIIHSEPIMNESRMFISVIPGSREQVSELKERWEK